MSQLLSIKLLFEISFHPIIYSGNSSPKELVTLLVQAGLFDTAISLCQTYNLSLRPVFEGLAFKYVIRSWA